MASLPEILLVDDEQDIRDVLSLYLTDMGYRVTVAENAEDALNCFDKTVHQIVLSDIKMPGMDGIELLKRIKQIHPDTEVIMITGHGDMDLAIKSLKYEATEFITKPINDDALEIALKRALERISMRNQLREYTQNLERMVAEKTRQLVEAERMAAIGQTVAGLAHAIKNMTGGLTGGMFVLEKGIELDNKTYLKQGWEMIRGNVEKIKQMALDLLNYSKSHALNRQPCHPNEPVTEVVDLITPMAQKYGIEICCHLDPHLTPVLMDKEAIHRCLMDLVTNAVDACADVRSTNKPGRVEIITSKPADWAVEYTVKDNGHGMPPEIQDKVFQCFFTTKGSKGTGLGLMMVRKIVDAHNGDITMNSQPNQGTQITIRLP